VLVVSSIAVDRLLDVCPEHKICLPQRDAGHERSDQLAVGSRTPFERLEFADSCVERISHGRSYSDGRTLRLSRPIRHLAYKHL
jgi:hypothetical protein